uniref:phage tail fiber protein n=1 Tax=Providencia stuartii TaxID=588 RepID=UPI00214D1CA6
MYNIGTVTTTANSTKLIGTGTKWKENISLVSPQQVVQVMIGTTVYSNSIHSIQSNTELTLNFPIPVAAKDTTYVILTTMVDSITDAGNKIVTMNIANVQYADIQNRIMTESGVIDIKLPDGTVRKTRTEAERDKLIDGKLNVTRPEAKEVLKITSSGGYAGLILERNDGFRLSFESLPAEYTSSGVFYCRDKDGKTISTFFFPTKSGTILTDQSYYRPTGFEGYGGFAHYGRMEARAGKDGANVSIADDFPIGVTAGITTIKDFGIGSSVGYAALLTARGWVDASGADAQGQLLITNSALYGRTAYKNGDGKSQFYASGWRAYTDKNTTKDSNGNLKAASPIVKVFADHIELNEESEGVEMEHLGVGHYLIKGVLGFNADGAWGINNGFVIPQDHNGKNMVLIDYDVKPDGDIELFVFHQQNTDMPERFQNKRIKDFGEDGQPIYFENYEPCDVPESRWIDMRVEMPPNSIYNLKQAEAERLAKEAAEKQVEEEAKKAELEAEETEEREFKISSDNWLNDGEKPV